MPDFNQLSDLADAMDHGGDAEAVAANNSPAPPPQAASSPLAFGIHRSFQFTHPDQDGCWGDRSERWFEQGAACVGEEVSHRCITSSGKIVKPGELRSRCFRCGGFEDDLVRNDITHEAICYRCLRMIMLADGSMVRTTPEQAVALEAYFDEWQYQDQQRGGK